MPLGDLVHFYFANDPAFNPHEFASYLQAEERDGDETRAVPFGDI